MHARLRVLDTWPMQEPGGLAAVSAALAAHERGRVQGFSSGIRKLRYGPNASKRARAMALAAAQQHDRQCKQQQPPQHKQQQQQSRVDAHRATPATTKVPTPLFKPVALPPKDGWQRYTELQALLRSGSVVKPLPRRLDFGN